MKKLFYSALVVFMITGCTTAKNFLSPAETSSGYTYIPVDPFAIETVPGANCSLSEIQEYERERDVDDNKGMNGNHYPSADNNLKNLKFNPLLESFPDNAVRMSIEKFENTGNVTYGPAGIGLKGESYRVTVDYVNSDTTNMRVWIQKSARNISTNKYEVVGLQSPLDKNFDSKSVKYKIFGSSYGLEVNDEPYEEFNIPVYVGIGLRVTANLEIIGSKVNISGLGAIGAEAESNSLKGNLIVQTLGINGNSVAAALPIQSELNQTTAANAIVAVGSIKALLYDEKTLIAPRVVGIYLPFPGGKSLVNAIISEISKTGIRWKRPCPAPDSPKDSVASNNSGDQNTN